MKAVRLHKIGDFRLDEVDKPKPVGDQILIKVGSSGICGSDLPRVYELGTSKQKYPLTLGHEFGGTIVEVGDNVDPSVIGKQGAIFPCIPCRECEMCTSGHYAMCLDYDYLGSRSDGGFAEYCLVPSLWHFVEANQSVSHHSLAMVEPCTVAQHALRKGNVKAGDNVLIFGAGPIGIMVARWASLFGATNIVLVDIDEEKIDFAKKRNLLCVDGRNNNIFEKLYELNQGKKYDVVIEGVGTGITVDQGVEVIKTFGTIVLMGNPNKDTTIKLHTHSNILRKEINLVGMWNSHYHPMPINEWEYTIKKLESKQIEIDDLVTHDVGFDSFLEVFEGVYNQEFLSCKVLLSGDKK